MKIWNFPSGYNTLVTLQSLRLQALIVSRKAGILLGGGGGYNKTPVSKPFKMS